MSPIESTPTVSSRRFIILGCGRVGSTLARQLSREGQSVTMLDLTSDAFRRLGQKFKGQRLVGNGLDQDVLRKIGIEQADVFIAVTQGDNTNIMAAQIAKEVFQVPKVLARIYDPIRAQVYRDAGIETLCSTTLAAGLLYESAMSSPGRLPWQAKMEQWDKAYLDQIC